MCTLLNYKQLLPMYRRCLKAKSDASILGWQCCFSIDTVYWVSIVTLIQKVLLAGLPGKAFLVLLFIYGSKEFITGVMYSSYAFPAITGLQPTISWWSLAGIRQLAKFRKEPNDTQRYWHLPPRLEWQLALTLMPSSRIERGKPIPHRLCCSAPQQEV